MPINKMLVVLFFSVVVQAPAQVVRSATSNAVAQGKASVDEIPYLDLAKISAARISSTESRPDVARATRYNIEGEKPLYDPLTGKFHVLTTSETRLTRDPLPEKSSDLVVLGTILSSEPRLSGDGAMVYSKFRFQPTRYLKNSSNFPPSQLVLDRIGGIAGYPNGMRKFVGATGIGLPKAGHSYLLFLAATSEPGIYEIKTGYGIDGNHVVSLDRDGDQLDSQSPSAIIREVQSHR